MGDPKDSLKQLDDLVLLARAAAKNAYCPYSKFRVGAAVLARNGPPFVGCNIENASYGLTICAERCSIFSLIAQLNLKWERLAVACPDAAPDSPAAYRMPCGACRQVMAEFAAERAVVVVDGVGVFSMDDLLPKAFRL